MDDRRPGVDRNVLRVALESHREQVSWLHVDALDDAQARLRIERIEQRRPCRRAAVALLVDIWKPAARSHMHGNADAINPLIRSRGYLSPLVPERHTQAFERGNDDVLRGHPIPPVVV